MIQNIVCTCNIGSTLYLPHVVRCLHVAEYNPQPFAAVTFRLVYPQSTALIFSSGKIVCTGTNTIMEARLALLSYVFLLRQRLQLPANVYQFQIQNMVASASVGYPIHLQQLYVHCNRQSSYDPELFPGLIYRDEQLPAVVLIFESGKMVITGAKRLSDIQLTYNVFLAVAQQYPLTRPPHRVNNAEVFKQVQKEVPILRYDDFAPFIDEHI